MKWINSYSKFNLLESSRKSKKEPIDFGDINNILPYTWSPEDPQIWRAHKNSNLNSPFIYRQPDRKRSVKGGLWISIHFLPSWKKFTDRQKATVATTSEEQATGWRSTNWEIIHSVMPLEDEVFISPSYDFNIGVAFPYFEEVTGLDSESDFPHYALLNFAKYLLPEGVEPKLESRPRSEFEGIIKYLDEDRFGSVIEKIKDPDSKINSGLGDKLLKIIDQNNIKNATELMDHLLDPKLNEYEKMKYTQLIDRLKDRESKYHNREVWFESDSIFIPHDVLVEMRK